MPVWDRIARGLLPQALEYLERAVPLAGERTEVVLETAKGMFADQPRVLKQIESAVHPAAVHYRSVRTGQNIYDASADVFSQWLGDSNKLSRGVLESAKAAESGAPRWQRVHMPADVEPITQQAKLNSLRDQLKRYTLAADAPKRERVQKQITQVAESVRGQQLIKDMPRALYLSPLSPVTKSDFVLGLRSRIPSDVAAATSTADANVKALTAAANATFGFFRNVGLTRGFKKDMQTLWESTLPTQERYYNAREVIEKLNAKIAKAKRPSEELITQRDKAADLAVQLYTDLQTKRKAAFSKYFNEPDVRIALWREPDSRPWVEHLMSEREVKAAQWHGALMRNAREHGTALHVPMLDQDREYITHLIHHVTRGGKTRSADVQAYIDRMLPQMVKFAQRTPGSLMFFPSVRSVTDAYIPMASRKFALTELMNKWQPIVEGPLKQWPRTQQYFTKYFKQYTDRVMEDRTFDKLFRGSVWWMYLSKTGASLSVGRKHAEKGIGLLATHPRDVLASVAPATRAGLQLALQRAGATPGSEARIIRNYVASRTFAEGISGLAAPERERTRLLLNTLFAFPTSGVEIAERGIGILAALRKGTRLGLSHDDIAKGIYQVLIDQSFMGKADRFLWLSKPWQQFLALFAYTPMRITDTTIKRALMSMPRKHLLDMQGDMLNTIWRFPTDVFGTPYVKNTLMFVGGVAATELFARKVLDASLWKEIAFHVSFLRERGGETELNIWPIDIYTEGAKRGGTATNPAPFVAAVADHLLSFPQWQRYVRTAKGDIAPAYAGSSTRQLFALPKLGAQHAQAERVRPRRESQQQRESTHARKYREQSWPLGSVLRALPPRIREWANKHLGL